MRSLRKTGYANAATSKVDVATPHERISMLYVAMSDRLKDMRYVLNQGGKSAHQLESLKNNNAKIREICNFLINAIYVNGVCTSNEYEKLYSYIKGNSAMAFIKRDVSAVERALSAVEELKIIWDLSKG